MANLIIVSGPQAGGKMTVAECLRDKIGYSLMVNHDSIEVSDKIFERGSSAQKELNEEIRKAAFRIAIKNNIDLIFTYVMAYDQESDRNYVENIRRQFEEAGGTFYFVELYADINERLARNVTPHRLESKLSKNDIERSTRDLIDTSKNYRLNSLEGEMVCPNHIKIDNTNLSPEEVVEKIIESFNLEVNKKEKH